MSLERQKRSKEKQNRAKDILRAAAFGAGVLIGAVDNENTRRITESAEDLKTEQVHKKQPLPEFRRSKNIDDRRSEPYEHPIRRVTIALDPHEAIKEARAAHVRKNEEPAAADSPLAIEAGARDLEKSPIEILRNHYFNKGKEMLKKELLKAAGKKRKRTS